MPQTSTIAFALIIGFIVFITVRGELPGYLGVVGLGSQANVAPALSAVGPASQPISPLAALPSLIGV